MAYPIIKQINKHMNSFTARFSSFFPFLQTKRARGSNGYVKNFHRAITNTTKTVTIKSFSLYDTFKKVTGRPSLTDSSHFSFRIYYPWYAIRNFLQQKRAATPSIGSDSSVPQIFSASVTYESASSSDTEYVSISIFVVASASCPIFRSIAAALMRSSMDTTG